MLANIKLQREMNPIKKWRVDNECHANAPPLGKKPNLKPTQQIQKQQKSQKTPSDRSFIRTSSVRHNSDANQDIAENLGTR